MHWPLIDRELRRREQGKATHRLRTALGGIAFLYLLFVIVTGGVSVVHPELVGRALRSIGNVIQFNAAVMLPLVLSAELVAKEKQERTLGLLLLADTTGFGVYGSKFLSAFLPSSLIILGALPVLALCAPFGGIDVPSLAAQTLLYFAACFTVTSFGMLASTYFWQTGTAFFGGTAFVFGWIVLCAIIDGRLGWGFAFNTRDSMNPLWIAWQAGGVGGVSSVWWISAIGALALGLLASLAGWRMLPRMAQDRPASVSVFGKRKSSHRAPRRPHRLYLNPLEAIVARSMGGFSSAIRPWPLQVAASLALIFLAPMFCVGPIFLTILLAYDRLSSLKRGKDNAIFDDIALAAGDSGEAARVIFRGQFFSSLFYVPALAISGSFGLNVFLLVVWVYTFEYTFSGITLIFHVLYALATLIALPISQAALMAAIACDRFVKKPRSGGRDVAGVAITYAGYLFISAILAGILAWPIGSALFELFDIPDGVSAILLALFYVTIFSAAQATAALTVYNHFQSKFATEYDSTMD